MPQQKIYLNKTKLKSKSQILISISSFTANWEASLQIRAFKKVEDIQYPLYIPAEARHYQKETNRQKACQLRSEFRAKYEK